MEHHAITSLAYLVSQYPAVSHTFILREVLQLREFGLRVRTASINSPQASADGLSEPELHEATRTFYIRPRSLLGIAWDHVACFASRPGSCLSGLLLALRLGGPDLPALLRHLVYFSDAVIIGQWMRRNALGHLHVHFANAAATSALIGKRIFGIPYSLTVHGSDEFYNTAFFRLRAKVEGAAFICCISRFCRSQLMKVSAPEHWEKMEICPLGVDPQAFRPRPAPASGVFRILCIGRLVHPKGHAIVLAAVAKLAGRGHRVHLDLVGDGPDRAWLESEAARLKIRENVTFHGSIGQHRIAGFLEGAGAFVLASFAEGVPVCLMEAMAMEIPCVSTLVGGIPELIDSGEDGILIPPSDPELLYAALEKLIGDPELRLCLGRAARRKVMEQYNLATNVERLVAVFARRLPLRRQAPGKATA